VEEIDVSQAALITTKAKSTKPSRKTTALAVSSDESDDEPSADLPFAIRDQELIKRAFAGADVVGDFEAEKRQTIDDEDEKIVDNTLPGWGSWTGDGLSKKERARNKGRFLTKAEGIKEQNRKDAKLDRVIINEKRVKKVSYNTLTTHHGLCLIYDRTGSILQQPYRILSRLGSNMKDPYDCR
jgi:U3 small nucleolar RNA-associated protein 14